MMHCAVFLPLYDRHIMWQHCLSSMFCSSIGLSCKSFLLCLFEGVGVEHGELVSLANQYFHKEPTWMDSTLNFERKKSRDLSVAQYRGGIVKARQKFCIVFILCRSIMVYLKSVGGMVCIICVHFASWNA